MRVQDYGTLGGYTDEITRVDAIDTNSVRKVPQLASQPDPMDHANYRWNKSRS